MPVGLRSRVPEKMTSCMCRPRRLLADCSPSTQVMASEIFDLPQPFGPTMAARPSPESCTSVRSQNDLNPRIWTFFSLSMYFLHQSAPERGAELPELFRQHQGQSSVRNWGNQ